MKMRPNLLLFVSLFLLPLPIRAADPVVARIEMKLTLKDKVIDVIQPGDLLTVLSERENAYVIQTFNGKKGAVSKKNAVLLGESVPIYDALISANAEDGRLYTLRASAHWAAGATESALKDYDKAIELGYDEAHAFTSRGLFHAATGNNDQALKDYSTAIEKDKKDDLPLINRAAVYIASGEYKKAIADYDSAVSLRPQNPVLFSQRAVAKKLAGDLEGAKEDYSKTIKLSEKDVAAWMGRGFVKYQLEDHAGAIEDFTTVVELAPQTAVAFNNRGFNYQILRKHDEALADFEKAIELAPRYLLALQNKAWLLAICEKVELRQPDAAIETAKLVNEITEFESVSDLTLLAAAYAAAEEFEEAIGWQEKAIEKATEEQAIVSKKILQLYQDGKPLDPTLLEPTESSGKERTASEPQAKLDQKATSEASE